MHRFFELCTEIAGWIQIVLSPLLIGLFIGAAIYLSNPSIIGAALAIAVILILLVLGILLANKAWKGKGTMHLMSRIMASPELDPKEETEKKNDGTSIAK